MVPFNQIKNSNILGLDDQITFGDHQGCYVSQVVIDYPDYIDWLIKNTDKQFYQSVHDELWYRKQELNKPKYKSNYIEDEYEFDDIPF